MQEHGGEKDSKGERQKIPVHVRDKIKIDPEPNDAQQHDTIECGLKCICGDSKEESNKQEPDSSNTSDIQDTNDELRSSVEKFMQKTAVENTFFILIILNSIMMGIGTFDFVAQDEDTNAAFFYCDLAFLFLFTVELGLTIFYRRSGAFKDLWVLFDLLIISVSWILSIVDSFDPNGKGGNGVQVIRSLRIFRILSKIDSWKEVLRAISSSIPKLGCLVIFTFIIMFIFAIFFTETYRDMYEKGQTDYDYFSRLDYSFFTLFQLLTLDAWIDVCRDIQATYPIAWIPIILYVCLAAFIIINLAIAIICESIFDLVSSKEDAEDSERNTQHKKDLGRIVAKCNEIYELLDLPKPETNGNDRLIFQGQAKVSVDDKSAGLPESMNGESASNDHHQLDPSSSHHECESSRSTSHELSSFRKMRNLCGDFVNHKYVQGFVVFIIIANSLILALATLEVVINNLALYDALELVNTVFLGIYTFENALQLIYHGPRKMFSDGWLTFDFILIVVSWGFSLSPAFRVFRVLRLVHLFPKFKAMRDITGTLSAAIPKISAIAGILIVFYYVFAVMFTTLFKDIPVGGEDGLGTNYFGRLDHTLLTLFQIMTMEDWATVSREVSAFYWWADYLVIFFLTISGLLFINAIVALICEAHDMNEHAEEEKEGHDSESTMEENLVDNEILNINAMLKDINSRLDASLVSMISSKIEE